MMNEQSVKASNVNDEAASLTALALPLLREGRVGEAADLLRRSIALSPSAKAQHALGLCHYQKGEIPQAVSHMNAAILLDSSYDRPYGDLARILHEAGQAGKAMEYSVMAVIANPGKTDYLLDFIELVKSKKFKSFNSVLKQAITHCLQGEGLYHDALVYPWLSLLQVDPAFKPYGGPSGLDYKAFCRKLSKIKDFSALEDPALVLGLRRLLVPDLGFEAFAANLRRAFCEGLISAHAHPALVAALAIYCHYTTYIIEVSPAEQEKIAALQAKVEADAAEEVELALLACYKPFGGLRDAAGIAQRYRASSLLRELVRVQIDEPARERQIRTSVRTLTAIDDTISRAVQEQYEEFPYPLWRDFEPAQLGVYEPFAGRAAEVLNAGCGTGREAIHFARAMPHARFTAIDLSRASLAYAIRKSEEIGLSNLEFYQADILEMPKTGRRFDLIVSSGVLHHMEDPLKGWESLVSMLNPGGWMRIALYSELARRDIVDARKVIAQRGYPSTEQGIRAFRREFPKIMRKNTAGFTESRDFFSFPTCRDLLFHVQEHRFDLPRIQSALRDLGLRFEGVDISEPFAEMYAKKNPRDPARTDFDALEHFERKNPNVFAGMYKFWCRLQ